MPRSADPVYNRSQTLISRLRMIVYGCGFTDEDVRKFGNLSKIDTWESLLKFYLAKAKSFDIALDIVLDTELDKR